MKLKNVATAIALLATGPALAAPDKTVDFNVGFTAVAKFVPTLSVTDVISNFTLGNPPTVGTKLATLSATFGGGSFREDYVGFSLPNNDGTDMCKGYLVGPSNSKIAIEIPEGTSNSAGGVCAKPLGSAVQMVTSVAMDVKYAAGDTPTSTGLHTGIVSSSMYY
jgi:hypothetical protein